MAGGRQGQAAGEGARCRTVGLCGDFVQSPGRDRRWDWLQRPIAAAKSCWEENSLSHSVPCTGRARLWPKLCQSVFTITLGQVRKVGDPAQDHTALDGQSKSS